MGPKAPKAWFDLHALSEEARIEMIVQTANSHGGQLCAVFVDDDAAADRYVARIGARARIVQRLARAVPDAPDVVLLQVGPKES